MYYNKIGKRNKLFEWNKRNRKVQSVFYSHRLNYNNV